MDEREHNCGPVPSEGEKAGSAINAELSATQPTEPAAAKLVENDPVVLDAAPPPAPIALEEIEKAPVSPRICLDKKHPLAIRWMHWINFPVLFTMIWSGLLIYWNDSDNAYKHPHAVYWIGVGPFTLVRFFPPWFWKAMNAPYHVTQGLGYHFFFMWLFAINGILYVLFTLFSGEWRFVVPDRKSLIEAIQVTLEGSPPDQVPPSADQVQRGTKNCLYLCHSDGRWESHHWPGYLQTNPGALGNDFVGWV